MALTDLMEAGNELSVELGSEGQSYGDYCKALLVLPQRDEFFADDVVQLQGVGYMGRILGGIAYKPVAAKVYDGPYRLHSRFEFDNGSARLTVRQVSGTWVAERLAELGRHVLHCKKPDAIALVPQSIVSQNVIFRIAFKAAVSIEGVYLIFWYGDEENYWFAGVKDDAGTQKLRIYRVSGGSATQKATNTLPSNLTVGNWYTMYLELRPGRVRVYLKNTDSYDFSTYHATASYTTTGETDGPPETYHMGLGVESFGGWEGAESQGTVTGSDYDYLEDTGASFTSAVVGKWVRCRSQDRQIVDYTTTKLYIQPSWSDNPVVGDEYGVYPESAKDGPQCYFKELWLCEGVIPWTVDDVADSILALSGVERSAVYPDTAVGTLSSGAVQMNDVDLAVVSAANPVSVALWASTTATTGPSAYSGLVLSIYGATTLLQSVEGKGSATEPYQTTTTVARHHNAVQVPTGVSRRFRIQASKDGIVVSCNGHFLTAFPTYGFWTGGWVARNTGDTATTTEFREILDSFIWDSGQTASTTLARLLRGRRAKVLERCDGSVAISRFDSALGDAGTYSTPVTRLGTGQRGTELVSLIEMVGAEERVFLIDETAARKSLVFTREDNPTIESQQDGLKEARKLAILGRQRFAPGSVALYAPDPGLELEDGFTVGSTDYIVESVSIAWEDNPRFEVHIRARPAPPAAVTANWGTDAGDCDYDDGTEYG